MRAMILAAGRGERMRPLTDHTPKPLLEIAGKPLIVWHIENLVRAGICELVINHAHLGAQIEKALGDGKQFGAHIQYSHEAKALETAGGIANALPLLLPSPSGGGRACEGAEGGGTPFAVINSDIFCDYDFAKLHERVAGLKANGDAAHLVLVNNPTHHPNGDFGLHDDRVIDSALSIQRSALTFSGIGLYQPVLFKDIPRGSIAPLAPLLRAQIALGKVSGEHHPGLWADVGTPQRLAELDSQVCALQKASRSLHNAP
ncbi:MAG: nucleotidyltransferase family protein [Gallionella sp.]